MSLIEDIIEVSSKELKEQIERMTGVECSLHETEYGFCVVSKTLQSPDIKVGISPTNIGSVSYHDSTVPRIFIDKDNGILVERVDERFQFDDPDCFAKALHRFIAVYCANKRIINRLKDFRVPE